ncbi:MAG: ABC transporter substrate-binding protein [Bacteroidetes bacterium]|nr:ABC transporter substrate-binding protein [Bacteroidota bacterium]
MKKTLGICLILLVTALITSCGRFANKESATTKNGKERIVCVSKQLTEFMFAVGAGDKLVGVDLSSTYPPEAQKLVTVGYHRMLSAEGIISLNPTLVIHNGGIAPESVITQLEKVGIPMKVYMGTPNIDSCKVLMMQIAREYNNEAKGIEMCNKLDADMKTAAENLKKYTDRPKVLIIHYGRQMNNYFVMGNRGTANDMLTWAGGVNAADTSGFRNLSAEVIVRSQPDVILATDFGFDRTGGEEHFVELPGINLTPAAKNHRIYRIEEHDLVYLGPRTGENVIKYQELIHKK